jgi:tRNA acetyltransferase TAN1
VELTEALAQKYQFFLVGCDTMLENDAMSEFWHVMIKYCSVEPVEVFDLPIRGLFLLAVKGDIQSITERLKQVIIKEQFSFRACRKFTPLDCLIKSSLEGITEATRPLLAKVPQKVPWRIESSRRHSKIKRSTVIEKIASLPEAPKGKVNLENPKWLIIIEIIGEWTGVGVFPADKILSVEQINS